MARTEQPDKIEGLSELAAVFGVSVQTVKRRLSAGHWPEVVKTEGTYGETWSLDRALEMAGFNLLEYHGTPVIILVTWSGAIPVNMVVKSP